MHCSWYSDFSLWCFLISPKLYISTRVLLTKMTLILSLNVKCFHYDICSDLAEKKVGMAKREGASADLPIKLTLVLDGQESYERDTHVIFCFFT